MTQLHSVNQVEMARLMMPSYGEARDISSPEGDIDERELESVAKEFESLFMHMMLKSMRTANRSFSEDSYFDSFETRMYEDMLDEKLSVHLGESHSLGIADLLIRQLKPQIQQREYDLPMGPVSPPDDLPDNPSLPVRQGAFQGPEDFVEKILPKATQAAHELGVDPQFIVAQAALETGWGQHMIFDKNGRNSHNLFGIKANKQWQGETASKESLEVSDGVAQQVRSKFKMYENYNDSIRDYISLVRDNPRYSSAINSGSDIGAFGEGLMKGGYATDPAYAKKLANVVIAMREH